MTTITHEQAIELLKQHGCTATENAVFDLTRPGRPEVEGTSFYDELGRSDEYSPQDVRDWLGY